MHILIITAHPSSKGLTHKVADNYIEGAKKAGHTTELLNVYTATPRLPYVEYEDYPDWACDQKLRDPYQQAMMKADRLVFIHPIWWGGPPAILKNFLEQTLTPGFAYKFGPRKFIPQRFNILPTGHFKGKKATVIMTCDAYWLVYAVMLFPFLLIWFFFVLFYVGIWQTNFHILSRVKFRSPEYREKWLVRAKRWGSNA
jgi:NAD(P)H dehydrogenase (quinone)